MALHDGSKRQCFHLWLKGKSVTQIVELTTAKRPTIRAWVTDWERGRDQHWGRRRSD